MDRSLFSVNLPRGNTRGDGFQCQRLLVVAFSQGLASPDSSDEHGSSVSELPGETALPPRPQSAYHAAAKPLAEVGLRSGLHYDGAAGRARAPPVRIECTLRAYPQLWRVVGGAEADKITSHVATLAGGPWL